MTPRSVNEYIHQMIELWRTCVHIRFEKNWSTILAFIDSNRTEEGPEKGF